MEIGQLIQLLFTVLFKECHDKKGASLTDSNQEKKHALENIRKNEYNP